MPNSSYLCSTDLRSLYPSTTDRGFDPAKGVVAFDVRCVPLLWLAMFRPADLSTQAVTVEPDPDAVFFAFDEGGGDLVEVEAPPEETETQVVEATAPLVAKDRALAQLDAAVPVLGRLFAAEGPLDEHAAMLRRAAAAPGAHLTIELDEIEGLWEPGAFQPALRAALVSLDGGTDPEADRARLVELAQLRPGRPFPAARLLFDDGGVENGAVENGTVEDDDYWNLVRLLGASFSAEVPWEPSAAG